MAVGPADKERVHYPGVKDQVTPQLGGVSMTLEMLEKVVRNLPKEKKPHLQFAAMTAPDDPEHIEMTTTDLVHPQSVAGAPKREPFPQWKNIIRDTLGNQDDITRLCFRRADLIEILRALEEACPDKGDTDPVFLEINADNKSMALRCVNRETGQRAIGIVTGYNTKNAWLPCDDWERSVLTRSAATPKSKVAALTDAKHDYPHTPAPTRPGKSLRIGGE